MRSRFTSTFKTRGYRLIIRRGTGIWFVYSTFGGFFWSQKKKPSMKAIRENFASWLELDRAAMAAQREEAKQ